MNDENAPRSVDELDESLSRPTAEVIELLNQLDGDIMLLGVGGKMGPTLARMARRAFDEAGSGRRVIGVSRFRSPGLRERLEGWGVETIACDLLDPHQVAGLPFAPLVVSMSGFKFGATSAPALSWATNCYAPALICQRFRDSRIVTFSSGNVYGLVPANGEGSREEDPLDPIGEYSMAALGRERMYEYFSQVLQIPMVTLRLNYSTELRYGVLVDLAQDVWAGRTIDVTMGSFNVVWQGDANNMTLRALGHCQSPTRILNLAGAEFLRSRDVCEQYAAIFNKPVSFSGNESERAYLNNGRSAYKLLGTPETSADQIIRWTADWVSRGGESLGKPTKFQVHDGKY